MSGACIDPTFRPPRRSRRVGRVRGPRRFRTLQRSRVRARSGPLTVTWSPRSIGPDDADVCVAYAIPTSVGNAVQRNTVRRRLRDAFAAQAALLPAGDVLVRVTASAESCTWAEISSSVAELTARLGRQSMAKGDA